MTERMRLGRYIRGALTLGDFVVLNLAFFLSLCLVMHDVHATSRWLWLIVNLSFIPSAYCYSGTHNDRLLYADRVVMTAVKSSALQTGVLLCLLYVFNIFDIPAWSLLVSFMFFAVLLSAWWVFSRWLLKKVRRMGFNFKRAVIIGAGNTGRMVSRELESDAGYGYRMMGVFDDNPELLSQIHDQFTGRIADVADFVHLNRIDLIYYTLDAEDSPTLRQIVLTAEEAGAELVYVPKFDKVLRGQFAPSRVGDMPAMAHSLSPLNHTSNRLLKRFFDLVVTVPFAIVSPVIFIPIAIGIKLTSPGPVFFRQKRTGIHGTEFVCYKFRTMRVNDESDRLQATEHDPRKTRFGDFLRRSSLDELPQFFNVLRGNMSVVGPRPHMISHTEEYSALIDKYMVRHAIKPGITGWAQVNGYRGATKHLWQMERRVEFDVWYIRNWNLFLDLKIVLLTMFNGLRGDKNAY